MTKTSISSLTDPKFDQLWEIYEYSFPDFEQRTREAQQRLFAERSDYRLDLYSEDGVVMGLMGVWDLPDFVYVEHLALSRAARGKGIGSKILNDLLSSCHKRVILDIDPPVDEISIRRLHFYQRLGFKQNPDFSFDHHPFIAGADHFQLKVLSYPKALSALEFERFQKIHSELVMSYI